MTARGKQYWDSGDIPLIAPQILGNIITEVADFAVVISDSGEVLSVMVDAANPASSKLEDWESRDFRSTLAAESVRKFDLRLAEFVGGNTHMRRVELNHKDSEGQWESVIRYSFHRIGPEGAILMLGQDLRPIAEMQQQLVHAQMAMEREYEAQREIDTRFRVLMEAMGEAVIFVSVQSGRITDANALASAYMGSPREDLTGSSFASAFENQKRGDLIEVLGVQAVSDRAVPITVRLRKSGVSIRITPTLFRAAGERVLLCRLAPEVDASAQADSLTVNLNGLYRQGPDAIVFASENGEILSANDAFLDLIDAAHDLGVKGRSIADYLLRGQVDLRVLAENAARAGRMRQYQTKISGEYGLPRAVEIAVTHLQAGQSAILALVIRDAGRAEIARAVGATGSGDNARSVMELVGSATLKDIVAETTDVVERMCIETAIELTMNNRVAAAEMLGLSRQSLYVKLRKYDLLVKGSESSEH